MKNQISYLGLILLVVTVAHAKERPEVKGSMQQMFNSLLNLQPFLASPEKFSNPKNSEIIRKDLNRLATFKHVFPNEMKNEEPGIFAISRMFHETIEDARERFKKGNYDYSRHRLRTATAFCFSCHSRVPSEKNFEDLQKRVEASQLTTFEKADVFAATRQFDKALKAYTDLLTVAPKTSMDVVEYTRSLRRALSITVRVKQNPKETLELIDSVTQRKDVPEFILRLAQQWRKDAQYWMDDKVTDKKMPPEELVDKAKKLIERAEKLQSFPADENGDISYLRASNYLHEALDESPQSKSRTEALYLLGVAYSALQDPTLWDLDRLYFESCIREAPHADFAKKCYQRFSEKVYMGYTGSAGTFIPDDEQRRLEELRKLSDNQAKSG
jgi:tetratricopeptide (TPR) repeat protein